MLNPTLPLALWPVNVLRQAHFHPGASRRRESPFGFHSFMIVQTTAVHTVDSKCCGKTIGCSFVGLIMQIMAIRSMNSGRNMRPLINGTIWRQSQDGSMTRATISKTITILILAGVIGSALFAALSWLRLNSMQHALDGLMLPDLLLGGYDLPYVELVQTAMTDQLYESYATVHYVWNILLL